jgi:hypothetical protein
MTRQAGDILKYKGRRRHISTEPLKTYLENRKDAAFVYNSTALVRGYIATWEIKNKRLLLISLIGFIENQKQVDLNFLFPNETEVFASWFSGDIRIPEGKFLKKINLGYASIFEKDHLITFENGILVNEWIRDNKKNKDII